MIHKFNGIVCLQMFENVFIVGYILFFFFLIYPSLFTQLQEIFCRCCLMLTRRIARPVCLHVFTPTREGIENKEFQWSETQNHSVSKQIVWKEVGVFRTMLPIFSAPGETFGSVDLRWYGSVSRPSTVGFVLVLRRMIKSFYPRRVMSLHAKEENSQFSRAFPRNVSKCFFCYVLLRRAVAGQSILSSIYFF